MNEKRDIKSKRVRFKKYFILLIILFVFLFVGIVGHYRSSSKSRLRLKIDELQAKGYPVTIEELGKLYSIPKNAENAADYILDAIRYYVEPNDSSLLDYDNLTGPDRFSTKMIENAKEYLRNNQKTLELLYKAGSLEYCKYPTGQTKYLKSPNIFNLQKLVKLLCVEAIMHAENGDSKAAAKALINSFNIADSLYNVPICTSQIGRNVFQENNAATLESIINIIDFNDEQWTQLSQILSEKQRLTGMSNGFVGQLCDTITTSEELEISNDLINGDNSSLASKLFYKVYRSAGLVMSDGIIYLDFTDKLIEAGKLPLHKRLDEVRRVQNDMNNISDIHVLIKATGPNYTKYFSDELVCISRFRVTRTALAVQRYRLKYGELPETLSNLVPEFLETVPLDPFDGKLLRYRKLDPGFVVYGVGENLIDDIGQETERIARDSLPPDITFIMEK